MKRLPLLTHLFAAALLGAPAVSSGQFWARLLNPEVTVDMRHPPVFGLEVETVVFGPASGECSDEIIQSLINRLVTDGIKVLNRQETDLILAEHQFSQAGWVKAGSAAAVGEMLGSSVMISVNVTRCATEQQPSYRDHVYERTNPDTDEKYEVREREFFSKTSAYLTASIQVTDMATGRIVGVVRSDYAPELVNSSREGQPVFPAEYDVLDLAYGWVNRDVTKVALAVVRHACPQGSASSALVSRSRAMPVWRPALQAVPALLLRQPCAVPV